MKEGSIMGAGQASVGYCEAKQAPDMTIGECIKRQRALLVAQIDNLDAQYELLRGRDLLGMKQSQFRNLFKAIW